MGWMKMQLNMYFKNNFICLFIFGCTGSWLLHGLFSSCGYWGLLSNGGVEVSRCGDFSCYGAWLWGTWASVIVTGGLSNCGFLVPEYRVSSCGTQVWLLWGMWDLPRSGMEPMSPALVGGFFTTEPSERPLNRFFFFLLVEHHKWRIRNKEYWIRNRILFIQSNI